MGVPEMRHRRKGRYERSLGAMLVGALMMVLGLPGAVSAYAEQAQDQLLHLIQFNMCGSDVNPLCGNEGSFEVADALADSIADWGARLVTVNEICNSQFVRVKSQTGFDGRFFETNGPNSGLLQHDNNCSDDRFGNAVFSDVDINGTTRKNLPFPGGNNPTEWRKIGCGQAPYLHTMRLCATHISPGTYTVRDGEVSEAAELVNTYVNWGFPVVLGGDFNAGPTSGTLDHMYNYVFGGDGLFGEGDQTHCSSLPTRCGQATHASGKIDYMFMDGEGGWCCPGAAVGGSRFSDHDVLRVSLRMQP